MYQALIFFHSVFRWLVIISLTYSIFRACRGYFRNLVFSETDNRVRHWTATISHIQLILGILIYVRSPLVIYFWKNIREENWSPDISFFGLIHGMLMLVAVVLITIGSALAKRRVVDREKFSTLLLWFSLALFIIFLAVPWPFSPLAQRPYFR